MPDKDRGATVGTRWLERWADGTDIVERVPFGTEIWAVLQRVLFFLAVLALPLLFISSSVTWAINDLGLYQRGFDKYRISGRTGIEKEELASVGKQIRNYFNSSEEPLQVKASVFGSERELFNQQEVLHMRDVKGLVRGVYRVAIATAMYLLLFVALGLLVWRSRLFASLARLALWGSGLTVALVALVGIFSLVAFDRLFLIFHQTSFSNNYWMLDPKRDYLLILFPQGFWLDATIFVALLTLAQVIVVGGAGAGALLLWRRRSHRSTRPIPEPSRAVQG